MALQRRMARIQLHVLKRCDWRMGLDDARDLRPALAVLTSHPDFSSYCLLIECEASRWVVGMKLSTATSVDGTRLLLHT